jgi:hypothetical protein
VAAHLDASEPSAHTPVPSPPSITGHVVEVGGTSSCEQETRRTTALRLSLMKVDGLPSCVTRWCFVLRQRSFRWSTLMAWPKMENFRVVWCVVSSCSSSRGGALVNVGSQYPVRGPSSRVLISITLSFQKPKPAQTSAFIRLQNLSFHHGTELATSGTRHPRGAWAAHALVCSCNIIIHIFSRCIMSTFQRLFLLCVGWRGARSSGECAKTSQLLWIERRL